MKVCFYSPYIPQSSLGGGEKHLFDIAEVVATKHDVFVAISEPYFTSPEALRAQYAEFVGSPLTKITFISTPLRTPSSFFSKLWWTRQFDHLFYWTDGSIFFSIAKKNNLHIQVPFTDSKKFIDRLKLANWEIKNTNSSFTKAVIEAHWHTKVTDVLHPMVDVTALHTTQEKEPIILHVGRFFQQLHAKRQDVLLELFKKLRVTDPKLTRSWKLVFIGAAEDSAYVQELKERAKCMPVEFYHSLSRTELLSWYKRAAIYWHATGYGADLQQHPEKAEHFGISTVEAMAAGAIPVVFKAGGQPEIIGPELMQLTWTNTKEAADLTLWLMGSPKEATAIRRKVQERAQVFGKEQFEQKVWSMLER